MRRIRTAAIPEVQQTNSMSDLPLFLTVPEVAQLLRTTPQAIYIMKERGSLPGVTRIGRRVLVRREDLVSWLRHKSAPSLTGE